MMLDTILCGDCMELLKGIPDKSIDLVVTDPPYELATDGAGFFGEKPDDYSMQYKGKKAYTYGGERYVMKEINGMKDGISDEVLDELCRVMRAVNIYLWCSQKQLAQYYRYFVMGRKCNWNLLSWHKTNPIPACGNKYLTDTEYCMFFRDKGVRVNGSFDTKRTFYVTQSNMADKRKYGHPTCKPLDIIKNLIVNSSEVGGGNSRPFLRKRHNVRGGGTTRQALHRHGDRPEVSQDRVRESEERIITTDIILRL